MPNPFFREFPGFSYQPDERVSQEFKRLARQRGWKPGSKTWKKRWNECMGCEYQRLIGNRINDLRTWQNLCEKLSIDGEFTSINKCRKALSRVYVNMVDLLECWKTKQTPRKFRNIQSLSKYTNDENLVFSRNLAKQDKCLRVLLKELF